MIIRDSYISTMLEGLHKITNAAVVLTGVVRGSETGVAMREKNGDVTYTGSVQVDGIFHGTGDVFASAMTGAYMKCGNLQQAVRIAVDFTLESILRTKAYNTEYRYGVCFEESIPSLIKALNL